MKQKMHHGSIKPKYVILGRLSNVGNMIKELKKRYQLYNEQKKWTEHRRK